MDDGEIPKTPADRVIIMFHKAVHLDFKDNCIVEVTFQDGKVKQYDLRNLFDKYPVMKALENRELFYSGKLAGNYGIIWTDELDLETETVYEEGVTVRVERLPRHIEVGNAFKAARAEAGISQKELSQRTGIDQSDISKIECGTSNPSLDTLYRLADALNATLRFSLEICQDRMSQ